MTQPHSQVPPVPQFPNPEELQAGVWARSPQCWGAKDHGLNKAKTQTGLKVFVSILDQVYQTGRKVTKELKQTMEIVFDDCLPQWNYTAKPQEM